MASASSESITQLAGMSEQPQQCRPAASETDEGAARGKLWERNELYRAIADNIQDGLTIVEGDQVIYVNDHVCDILGYPREALMELDGLEIAAPEEKQRLRELMNRTRQGDVTPEQIEFWIVRPDGTQRCIQNRYSIIREGPQTTSYLIITTDITERKRTQSTLNERVKELTCLYAIHRNMQEQLSINQLCHRVIKHVRAAMQFPDITMPVIELYGIQFTLSHHNYDNETLTHRLYAPIKINDRICGQISVYYLKPQPFLEPEEQDFINAIAEALGLWLERQQAEKALRDSERQLRAQYRNIPIPTCTWKKTWNDLVLVDCNDSMLTLAQCALSDIVGTSACEMYRDTPAILDDLTRCIREKTSIERQITRKDGDTSQYLAIKCAYVPPDMVSIYTEDITENQRMAHYMLQAERLSAMGYMATTLAHEIQNPLQAIQSHLELILDFELAPETRQEYLHFCCQEIEHLTRITNNVLDFARSSRSILRQTSIIDVIQRVLSLMEKQLEHARIDVTTELPTDLPPVLVVPDQILQVLMNLLINGIEAMPNGGHIAIEASSTRDELTFTLTNDGPSIPPDQLAHIFDPFYTTKPDGTGLGLFVSHNIIQQHGGTIQVENLPDGQGVAFSITLFITSDTP